MKRFILILVVIALTIGIPLQQVAFAEAPNANIPAGPNAPAAPNISATSAIVIDAKTGNVLFEKNSNERRPMASTTKIMTALVAIKYGNLADVVTVNGDVVGPGSLGGIDLQPGEQLTLKDLLYALLLPSANDAAVAIADHIGGSVGGFAAMMNQEAASIGATNTHFTNPHGLDDPMHYTTAHDLAIIAKTALQNPVFSQIVSTKTYSINRPSLGFSESIENENKLLSSYPGATGVKTGYTSHAGNCLVSSATRGGVSLISVVLGVDWRKDLFDQSAALLDYGFSLYKSEQLISKGVIYKKIALKDGRQVDLVAANSQVSIVPDSLPISTETTAVASVHLPVKKGTVLGKIIAYQVGQAIAASDLVAKEDIKPLPRKPSRKPSPPKSLSISQLAGDWFLQLIRKVT